MQTDRDWTVLLIGGGSCTGKSQVSRALARLLDLVPVDADLYWIALQRAVPREIAPWLHAFLEDQSVWSMPTSELVQLYSRVAEQVCQALAFTVAHHDHRLIPAVIEGSWITPNFARNVESYLQAGDAQPLKRPAKAIFLYEPSLDELDWRLHERGGEHYKAQPRDVQESQSRVMFEYGLEMKRQAEALEIPVLESTPFDTLLDRVVASVG